MSRNKFWEIPAIQCHEPDDGVFYAQLGPTGGKQGYSAITGLILFYLNKSRQTTLALIIFEWIQDMLDGESVGT